MTRLTPAMLFTACALAVTLGTGLLLGYLTLLERPFLVYTNLPFPVLKKVVNAGDTLPLRVNRCNNSGTTHTYAFTRMLQNLDDAQLIILLEGGSISMPPGCSNGISLMHQVPASTPPGTYRLQGVATVPGIIRNFLVDWYSEPFSVVKAAVPEVRPLQGRKITRG